MKYLFILSVFVILGAGCSVQPSIEVNKIPTGVDSVELMTEATITESRVELPIEGYAENRWRKAFGEFIQDRFFGYHVGDDIEYQFDAGLSPVKVIADGTVRYKEYTAGYGGLMIIEHHIAGKDVMALYGHLDLNSAQLNIGDEVSKGEFLANLGDHESSETDGERKHLHFALYEGRDIRVDGYESTAADVENWINPQDIFKEVGLDVETPARRYNELNNIGVAFDALSFDIPAGMEVEYVPSLQALNIFTLAGEGTARDRSQIFIRFFDASQFLTLDTVTINSTEDLEVGSENYTARRYGIEKKPGVPNFKDQPSWRNEHHVVTDFAKGSGQKRYYVVAANPELNPEIYLEFLKSVIIE